MTTASTTSDAKVYAARAAPVGKTLVWVLEGDVLVEDGARNRRLSLADLRTVNLTSDSRGLIRRSLKLDFGRGRLVRIPSLSFEQRLAPVDQSLAFSTFVRELLFAAARTAPAARFETGESKLAKIYLGAGAIVAVGILLTVMAAVVADAGALGLEIAARLGFVMILMIAAWPWVRATGLRAFDPRAIPRELLP